MNSHFFAYMYRLRYIERWSLMRNVMKENVAEHSFHVAMLTHALCTIANTVFERSVPTDRIVSMALFHDATEVFTGDIPTPVKHHNPKILSNFREIEQLAAERLLDMIPEPLRQVYDPLIDAKKNDQDAAFKVYLKAADLLDAYLKCVTELSAGNREFATAKKQIEESMAELALPELNYFLEHMAPSFEKTVDEL
ncbi:5'-deoxynucleotidase [Paenibacillus sp. UNCCL117]|uniref:5'-deoxynucleotidase n=1 Tax=unclassified Paenibacillus TaxID=185978 RepID=UPI00088C4897|nr:MULTISPECIES: 5'-deoxynucleotidase [unclassified Paenibacillus]SDC09425.1 5'-deoxynucleotidase [Paenibacillus sp. cl123]SFW38444.1 5'-deoxynucleotidase [Paenibacillus sp. UNCCL117]